jgi:hypothetical protein
VSSFSSSNSLLSGVVNNLITMTTLNKAREIWFSKRTSYS